MVASAAAVHGEAMARRRTSVSSMEMMEIERRRQLQQEVVEKAVFEAELQTLWFPLFWQYQYKVRILYRSTPTELFVASLICGNFIMNLIEGTFDPHKDKLTDYFGVFELFFNIAFTIELVINMYSSWFLRFWKSAWNVFDFVVVAIGLLTTCEVPLPGPLKMLRMMRAFRVFRLFKRIESLRKLMSSLGKAIPGVFYAFVVLVLVMSIYSILAVEFFSTYGIGGKMHNERGFDVPLRTARGQDFGWEYFGNFPKALYTMFQVMTGDSWSEAIARPLMHTPNVITNIGTAFYFISFNVLCATILINVVVAVLLEKMVDDGMETLEGDDLQEYMEEVLEKPSESLAVPGATVCQLTKDVASMRQEMKDIKSQLKAITLLAAAESAGHSLRDLAQSGNGCTSPAPPVALAVVTPPEALTAAVLESPAQCGAQSKGTTAATESPEEQSHGDLPGVTPTR